MCFKNWDDMSNRHLYKIILILNRILRLVSVPYEKYWDLVQHHISGCTNVQNIPQGGCQECTRSGPMHNSCRDSYVITVEQRSYPMGIGHGFTNG